MNEKTSDWNLISKYQKNKRGEQPKSFIPVDEVTIPVQRDEYSRWRQEVEME